MDCSAGRRAYARRVARRREGNWATGGDAAPGGHARRRGGAPPGGLHRRPGRGGPVAGGRPRAAAGAGAAGCAAARDAAPVSARALPTLPSRERGDVSGRGAEPGAVWTAAAGADGVPGGGAICPPRPCAAAADRPGGAAAGTRHPGALDPCRAARTLEPVEEHTKAALRHAPVLHRDETGVRRGGKLAWAHVVSTDRLTHYAIHAQRSAAATDAIGILPDFRGVRVHDGFASYRTYRQGRHALCNVHHLRFAGASSPSWKRSTSKPCPIFPPRPPLS